ncbi:hypothetical protein AGMMS49991_03250 [Spirochaetia bacterium]|nr:hypothetical protein AGMMS49991_03250 [Spirochaetia bacterium]
METKNKNAEIWYKILDAALLVPGVKIDREVFLQKEYGTYCKQETVEKILQDGSVNAGIELPLMDKIASDTINSHSTIVTAGSFIAGIPGGLLMTVTIPADVFQFYCQIIQTAQKLAYIYGMTSFEEQGNEFKSVLTVLIGVMAGIEEANETLKEIMNAQFSKKMAVLFLKKSLDKPVAKVAIKIGLGFANKNIFKSIAKALPLIGGIVSGGITLASFLPMCSNLKNKLHNTIENAPKDLIIR